MKKGPTPISPAIRFWLKVQKDGPIPSRHPELGPCWIWTGHLVRGHGQFYLSPEKTKVYAHRFSFELANGPIPDGLQLDHRCHNRSCVNPEHLRLATPAENNQNMLMHQDNQFGLKGIKRPKHGKKWQARIQVDKKTIHLGAFPTPGEAHQAYCEAASKYFGEFANPGE